MAVEVEVREGQGAEHGPGLRKRIMTRTRPGTALAFFILPACVLLTPSNFIP
jgi:hypothetical protein